MIIACKCLNISANIVDDNDVDITKRIFSQDDFNSLKSKSNEKILQFLKEVSFLTTEQKEEEKNSRMCACVCVKNLRKTKTHHKNRIQLPILTINSISAFFAPLLQCMYYSRARRFHLTPSTHFYFI